MEKQYKLPREFGEKWLAALRSGEYKQTLYKLWRPTTDSLAIIGKRSSGYCCLGVAGIICGVPSHYLAKYTQYASFASGLEIDLVPWELHTDKNKAFVTTLMSMNDSGKTFTEIADWIEDHTEFYEEEEVKP